MHTRKYVASLRFSRFGQVFPPIVAEHTTKYAPFVARFIMNFDAYTDGVTMLYWFLQQLADKMRPGGRTGNFAYDTMVIGTVHT